MEPDGNPLPGNSLNRNTVATIVATGLRQLSLRGYGNRRYGVTAIVATELRQSSLRGYDNCRYGVTINLYSF